MDKFTEYTIEHGKHNRVSTPFRNTHKADTLEKLAEKIEVDPAILVATVKRYNELDASGKDTDFGKPANQLFPVNKQPFYGTHRPVHVSAICSGPPVYENHQCLNAEGNLMNGLHAVGNLGGVFYGGVDYTLIVYGLSLGRCYTFGYLVEKYVAKL